MSSLSVSANPKSLSVMLRDVNLYLRVVRSHLLANGWSWDALTPSRKSKSAYHRFCYFFSRFQALKKLPLSRERDDALRVLHTALWREAVNIDNE